MLKKPLGFESRYTAVSGRNNRLPVARVMNVTSSKHARHVCLYPVYKKISKLVHVELAFEQISVRNMPNCDEYAVYV